MNTDTRRRPGAPQQGHVPFLELIGSLLRELPGVISDRVQLLSLELQRAGRSLAKIAVFVAIAAILLFTAWVTFWIGVGLLLVAIGLHWGWAVIIILALNIGAAVFLLLRARALLPNLTMPATMRHLSVADLTPRPGSAPAEAAPAQPAAPVPPSAPATGPVQP